MSSDTLKNDRPYCTLRYIRNGGEPDLLDTRAGSIEAKIATITPTWQILLMFFLLDQTAVRVGV